MMRLALPGQEAMHCLLEPTVKYKLEQAETHWYIETELFTSE